jgi:hypothetical protein
VTKGLVRSNQRLAGPKIGDIGVEPGDTKDLPLLFE